MNFFWFKDVNENNEVKYTCMIDKTIIIYWENLHCSIFLNTLKELVVRKSPFQIY